MILRASFRYAIFLYEYFLQFAILSMHGDHFFLAGPISQRSTLILEAEITVKSTIREFARLDPKEEGDHVIEPERPSFSFPSR